MTATMRLKLAAMMFLEYAIWGAWMPILGATLFNRGIAPQSIGMVYAAMWLACAISPFLGGQLTDRFMPSQVFLGVSHLLAAGAAFIFARQDGASQLMLWMFIWAMLFAPSLAITNAIAFHHIEAGGGDEASRERDFSWIRTAGTIGWIAAAFVLVAWMSLTHADPKAVTGAIPEIELTALFGVAMGLYSFFLPHTPPARDARVDPLAFRRAFSMFVNRPGFAVFMLISFVAATEFQFFYVLSAPFLESLSIPHVYVPVVKSLSQVAEIVALAVLLPLWLPKKGMRWCLLLGSFVWPIRYLIFALGGPVELIVASLALHGFGFAFVLVVQQLYVDRVSPRDIRSSAQSLLTFATLGVGNLLGSLFCGWVQERYTINGQTEWTPVFVVPAILTFVCAVAYLLTFREPRGDESVQEAELKTISV